jgi:hypothetical protein
MITTCFDLEILRSQKIHLKNVSVNQIEIKAVPLGPDRTLTSA